MKKFIIITLLFAIATISSAQPLPKDQPKNDVTSPNAFEQNTTPTGGINNEKATGGINDGPKSQVLPKIGNPLKDEFSDIPSLVNGLVKIALQLGTIIAVLALVWVGFKFIIAQGNPTEIAKAREALWWVIIGITILFGAQIIVEIIKGTLSEFVDPAKINFTQP